MNINELANKYYSKLNETDLYILKYINQNKAVCSSLSIEQMAKNCNVSRSTILRFAQKLSLSGYSELKVYLKWQGEQAADIPQTGIIDMVCHDYEMVIKDMKAKDCSDICKDIYDSDRVFIYGTGSVQRSVAKQMQRMFLDVGKATIYFEGTTELKKALKILTPDDFVILISLSGESKDVVCFARELSSKDIPTLSITKLNKNELASLSTYNIYMTSSIISIGSVIELETTALFFIIIELLTIKYLLFLSDKEET